MLSPLVRCRGLKSTSTIAGGCGAGRGGDGGSKTSQHSPSPVHTSPLQNEVVQMKKSLSSTPNLNPAPSDGSVKGTSVNGKGNDEPGTAVPAVLGGRTTAESQPVHKPSQGFRGGGERMITKIDEEVTMGGGS